jgi:uncharacterized protein YqiB (DUF1249 family)
MVKLNNSNKISQYKVHRFQKHYKNRNKKYHKHRNKNRLKI